MICIRYGIINNSPGLVINIWRLCLRFERRSIHSFNNFIRSVNADRKKGVLKIGQQFTYNILNLSLDGSKDFALIGLRVFSLAISFGFSHFVHKKKFFEFKYYKMEKP